MTPRRKLMTKNALAIEYLAKDFISRDIGSKILTISEYEKMIDVARGTIQNAIKQLVDSGAIAVESRGQLGTYLSHKDLKLLLEFRRNFIFGWGNATTIFSNLRRVEYRFINNNGKYA
ncbi:hypothetical protein MGH68_04375 [Erysipelothrix sp. D19-032]